MLAFHNTVGTLVLLGYLTLTILNVLMAGGRTFPWARGLSFGVATLLLLQYLLGFSLLADGFRAPGSHYILALLSVFTVGFEHGFANRQPNLRQRGRLGAIGTGLTFLLVLIAYIIGSSA